MSHDGPSPAAISRSPANDAASSARRGIPRFTAAAHHVVHHSWFQRLVIAMIALAGVLAGLETSATMVARHGTLLQLLDGVVLAVFVAEAALKIVALRSAYFRDGWNVFDFTIVALCLLPLQSQFAVVLRLVRALRLLRLVTALPKLQLLVGALLKSISSMGYVSVLLGLMFYIYAVAGVHLFGLHDATHFGSLPVALLTLFQIITLDNWSDIFNAVSPHHPLGATFYFISFILLGTMIMLNLFIGVITNSMAEMHKELDDTPPPPGADKSAREEA
jgi:voltage-gated sodium channel